MYLITYIIYVYWNLKINLIYDVILRFAGQHNIMAIKKVWNNFIDFKGKKKKKPI